MSRIAKSPITVASGIEVKVDGQNVTTKGSKGTLKMTVHPDVTV
ncbi:MAG: 50S ribosomal protein L6, partial [Chromatiales bacterium]